MKHLKIGAVTLIAFLILSSIPYEIFARSRGGGFSRSSSRSSSSRSSSFGRSSRSTRPSTPSRPVSRSTTTRPKTTSQRSSTTSAKPKTFGSSTKPKTATTTKPASKNLSGNRAQNTAKSTMNQKMYQQAQKQKTTYTNKADASKAFKQKYSNQYTSKYAKQPATRPDHVPSTYRDSASGSTYNISFNQGYGGYGYWRGGGPGIGTWMMYNAMSDAIMMNTLMNRHSYYYGAPPVYSRGPVVHTTYGGNMHHRRSGTGIGFWIGLFFFVGFVVIVVLIVKKASSASRSSGSYTQKEDNVKKKSVILEESDCQYWRDLKKDSVVNLTDFQAIQEHGMTGRGFRVSEIRPLQVKNSDDGSNFAELLLYTLQGGDYTCYMLAVLFQDEVELRAYYIPDGFEPSGRADLIERDICWFFDPPESENWAPSDLTYCAYPEVPPIMEGGVEKKLSFEKEKIGDLFPSYSQGGREIPCILAQYATQDETENPLLLILEEGYLDQEGNVSPEGGLVTVMLGCAIGLGSVDIYPPAAF